MVGAYDGIKEINEIYNKTDILYCAYDPQNANWKMSYPVKFYESILSLTPIIVSENTTVSDYVKKNNIGYIIDIYDEKNIINLFEEELRDKDKRCKIITNIKMHRSEFTWEEKVKELNRIYTIK